MNGPEQRYAVTNQPKKSDDYGLTVPMELKHKGNVPPGMEYLASIDQLLVKQVIELLEGLTLFETKNRYVILNSMGQKCMFMYEESHCMARQCWRAARGFKMQVVDNNNHEIMRMSRECACSCCWCVPCCDGCATVLRVEAPPGNFIGSVKQEGYCWKLKLGLYDENEQRVGLVRGPCCPCTCPCCPEDIDYHIMNHDESTQLAVIAKQWAGYINETLTKADHFSVTFPLDLDIKMKILAFAAFIQVEFLQFEGRKK